MTIQYHIKQIENLLNKEKITKYNLLQTAFNISCVKFELSMVINIFQSIMLMKTNHLTQ